MAYVYLHTKPNGEIFYVGKGNGYRAYDKNHRSEYWKRVVNKYGYEVRVFLDNVSDEKALSVFAEYGTHLGKVIKTILFSVDPKAIVLGGSVSRSFEYYKIAMWKEIATFPYQFVLENFVIVPSVVKEIAILGAAALYIDAVGED